MKTWKVVLFAISNTAVYFWCPVENIPAVTEAEAGQKAVLHAMTQGLRIQVEVGSQVLGVKPVFAMPFTIEEQKKVEVYTSLPKSKEN